MGDGWCDRELRCAEAHNWSGTFQIHRGGLHGISTKVLQQVGLVSTLLIVGILGGLMAPLPSEAAPTVTLKVDSGTATSILTATGDMSG